MAKFFFTADTHFGDQRTWQLSRRPFSGVPEMDKTIINNWNQVVGPKDIVYHLGDFGTPDIVQYLNGDITLLPGNYDQPPILHLLSNYCKIIAPNTVITVGDHAFQLVHEPSSATPSEHFFLFGHIHKLQMVKRNGLNVGVDCHNFAPIALDDVLFYRGSIQKHYDENVFLDRLGSLETSM